MKRLLSRLALFFVPVMLYAAVFVAFEPYNYFGLRKNTAESDQVIYRVRSFVNDPQDAVILGDSRLAHFDMRQVDELCGRKVSNLAFGGASQKEIIDLFYFAVEQNPDIDTVYLEVSFYILNTRYDKDRTANIRTIVTNPLAYLFNFDYNIEMLNTIRQRLSGQTIGAADETATYTAADYTDASGAPLPYRRQLMEYNESILPICTGWSLNTEQAGRLLEVAEYCRSHGIRLVFVLPPVADSVYNEILVRLGIDGPMTEVVQSLTDSGAEVRDFELTERPAFEESQFFDGFHIDTVYGLPQFAQLLFGTDG